MAFNHKGNCMRCGGVILCGGQSTRMGRSKAWLPFGPEVMLTRMVRLLETAVSPIVVVAAPEQALPPLPAEVIVARDEQPGRGPLAGLAAGFSVLGDLADAVFVTGCDTPLLDPRFVTAMLEKLGDYEIAVPIDQARFHPLAAVYRPRILPQIQALLVADQLRTSRLFEQVRTLLVPVEELRSVDPELRSLLNLNHPQDYQQALGIAGFAEQADDSSPASG